MKPLFWETLGTLFTSKKWLATLAGVLVAATNHVGLHLAADQLNWVLTLIGAYVVGQGVADHGKEAAKITAMSVAATTAPTPPAASSPK